MPTQNKKNGKSTSYGKRKRSARQSDKVMGQAENWREKIGKIHHPGRKSQLL
jgi:hypothetical protein